MTKFEHSSKRNPCPICHRNDDDKCRWTDELIFCYFGSSFSPPDLPVGATLDHPERGLLAVLSRSAGWGGGSMLLGPHRASQGLPGATWGRASIAIVKAKVHEQLKIVRNDLKRLRDGKPLDCIGLDEIRLREQLAKQVWDDCIALKRMIRANLFYWENIKATFLVIEDSIKQARYAYDEIQAFRKGHLGEVLLPRGA